MMSEKKPIHLISKDLGIEAKKVIKACNEIGIYAKGSSKRLNNKEEEKIKAYFNNGKNVANEVIDIKIDSLDGTTNQKKFTIKSRNNIYFPNRLIK